jgi:hypothetical protein
MTFVAYNIHLRHLYTRNLSAVQIVCDSAGAFPPHPDAPFYAQSKTTSATDTDIDGSGCMLPFTSLQVVAEAFPIEAAQLQQPHSEKRCFGEQHGRPSSSTVTDFTLVQVSSLMLLFAHESGKVHLCVANKKQFLLPLYTQHVDEWVSHPGSENNCWFIHQGTSRTRGNQCSKDCPSGRRAYSVGPRCDAHMQAKGDLTCGGLLHVNQLRVAREHSRECNICDVSRAGEMQPTLSWALSNTMRSR